MTSGQRTLLLVNAVTGDPRHRAEREGATDRRRPDFDVIAERLDADVLDLDDVRASRIGRRVERRFGGHVALALVGARRARSAKAFVTLSENEALVLAVLLRMRGLRTPVVAVAVHPAKANKRKLWRRAAGHLDKVLCLGTAQAELLVRTCGVPEDLVDVLPHQTDPDFWDPAKATPVVRARPYLLGIGLKHRDYPTLVAAADGLDVDLVIAAASPWSDSPERLAGNDFPDWVQLQALGYRDLRDAYAGAAVVVVPTVDTDFQPGTTAMLEAMSMARPVVVTRAEGNGDYLSDRRQALRDGSARPTSGGFGPRFLPPELVGQTGCYVAPGDVEDLRLVLLWLLTSPTHVSDMTERARAVVREVHSVDTYADRIAAAVDTAIAAH